MVWGPNINLQIQFTVFQTSNITPVSYNSLQMCYLLWNCPVQGPGKTSGPEKLLENTFVSSQQYEPWCYYSPAIACIYLFFHPSICLPVSVSVWHIHCVVLKFLVTLCDSVHICYWLSVILMMLSLYCFIQHLNVLLTHPHFCFYPDRGNCTRQLLPRRCWNQVASLEKHPFWGKKRKALTWTSAFVWWPS